MNLQGNINRLLAIGAGVKAANSMKPKAVETPKETPKAKAKTRKKAKSKTRQVTPAMAMNYTRGVGQTSIEQNEMFAELREQLLGGYSDGE